MSKEREKLSFDEKVYVLETSIDREKVNKNSKFNKSFCDVVFFLSYWAPHATVISAELYTREEAEDILYKDRLDCWYTDPGVVEFGFVKMGYLEDVWHRVRVWPEQRTTRDYNFYKPVFYIEL